MKDSDKPIMITALEWTTCPFCKKRVKTTFYAYKTFFESSCPKCRRKWRVYKNTFKLEEIDCLTSDRFMREKEEPLELFLK